MASKNLQIHSSWPWRRWGSLGTVLLPTVFDEQKRDSSKQRYQHLDSKCTVEGMTRYDWAGHWKLQWRSALVARSESQQIKILNISKVHTTCHFFYIVTKASPVSTWHLEPSLRHFLEDEEFPLLRLNKELISGFFEKKREEVILGKIHGNVFWITGS